MQLSKFVIKCGSFAVLVDLHVLPQSGEESSSSSWFSEEHREEVSALIKDAVDQRVRQFLEARQGPTKQKKELSPHNPLCIKGGALLLAAYFMKRHVNLRCVLRHNRHKLRVFPERFVVCVSRSDENTAPAGSTKLDVTEQSGPSRSGYFSSSRETLQPLNISTITKMAALQKIRARQVDAHPPTEPEHETHNQNQNQGAAVTQPAADGVEEVGALEEEDEDEDVQRGHEADKVKADDNDTKKIEKDFQIGEGSDQSSAEHHAPEHEPNVPPNPETTRRRRRLPSSPGPAHQQAKRVCLREPGGGSSRAPSRSSALGPGSGRPGAGAGTGSGSEGVLEEELLTREQQPQLLPLGSSNSTKHITQSLRVLESKSSGSSTGPTTAADRKPSAPRVSRLRRVKKP